MNDKKKSQIGNKNHFFGKHHTEETKKKISLAKKGIKHGSPSEETKKKISLAKMGHTFSQESKQKIRETLLKKAKYEEKNPFWKGDRVGYVGLHLWVQKWKGKPETCEKCGREGLTGRQIGWANIDHKYRRVLDDYIRLCRKCHKNYDTTLNLENTRSHGQVG